MSSSPEPFVEPGWLKLLRGLVMVLTVVMIGGMVTIVTVMVLRYNNAAPLVPESIALPEGASAVAFTQGTDWVAVVTDDDRILIYDRDSGTLRQTVTVKRGE